MRGKRKELTKLTKNKRRSRLEAVSHSFSMRNTRRKNSRASSHEDKVEAGFREGVQGRELGGRENLKWNTGSHRDDGARACDEAGSTRPGRWRDKPRQREALTNVTKCSGRSTHQGATRKLISQTSRVEEVCLWNACMSNVHMTCLPPPTQRNHKGWRSAPDAILPGHRWHPSGSGQGHPRYTGARTTERPWVARHQRHK